MSSRRRKRTCCRDSEACRGAMALRSLWQPPRPQAIGGRGVPRTERIARRQRLWCCQLSKPHKVPCCCPGDPNGTVTQPRQNARPVASADRTTADPLQALARPPSLTTAAPYADLAERDCRHHAVRWKVRLPTSHLRGQPSQNMVERSRS